jgi:streptogramin lyase
MLLSRSYKSALVLLSLAEVMSVVLMSGCGSQAGRTAIPPLQGRVQGGQQPVVGAAIVLYAAGATGYGSTASSLLTASVTSGAGGGFSITGLYTCPLPSTQVYIVASGGNPGSGANSALALMAALGSCGNLTASTFININELTTVAAVYSLSQFMATNSGSPGASLGASSTNSTGLANAFATAGNLVDTVSGLAPGASLPSGASVPTAELNTLADLLANCVNSNGSTGECSTLFSDATPSAGSAPQNTIDAALDISQNPGNNVSTLYNLLTGTPPFQPTLSSAPNDWIVAINYSDGGLNGPASLAVDSSGNVWVVNTTGNSLSKFSNSGTALSGSSGYIGGGLTNPRWVAIDTLGNIWLTNANDSLSEFSSSGSAVSGSSGYTGGGLNSPQGIALATGGQICAANNGANSLTKFAPTGTPNASSPFSGGGLNAPFGVAVSNSNIAWISNANDSLSEFATACVSALSGPSGFTGGGLNSPRGIAIDQSGHIWVANSGASSLSEFNSSGTAISSSSGYTGGGLVDPTQIAVDGLGNVWVSSPSGNRLSEFSNSGTAISGSSGYTGGGLGGPGGFGSDGSGDVWVPDFSINQVTELVGAAAPVTTSLITAVKSNKLGQRP